MLWSWVMLKWVRTKNLFGKKLHQDLAQLLHLCPISLSTTEGDTIMGGPVRDHLGITESLSRNASKFFIYQHQ